MTSVPRFPLAPYADRLYATVPWLARWVVLCVIVPILALGLVDALDETRAYAHFIPRMPSEVSAAVAAILVFLAAFVVSRRRVPFSPLAFVAITFIAAAYLRYFYSISIRPEWISDFAYYWDIALQQVSTSDYRATSLYHERTLPVLVPIVALLGPDKGNVVLANIAMLGVAQVAGYDLLRRVHSHQAAQCFTLVFAAAPIPLFAMMLPSHDLWAMCYLAIVLWLCAVVLSPPRRWRTQLTVAAAFMLAVLCLLIEIQRGIGTLLAATLLLVSTLAWLTSLRMEGTRSRTRPLALALACLGAFVLQFPLGSAASHQELRAAQSPAHQVHASAYYAAAGTSLGNGTWAWLMEFRRDFTEQMADDPPRLSAFSRSMMLSDWVSQPEKRVQNIRDRMGRLFIMDNSNPFYFVGADPALEHPLNWLQRYSLYFSTAFSVLLLLALARMIIGAGVSTPTLAGLALTSLAALLLAAFSESQPRYLLWMWLAGGLFLAEMASRSSSPPVFSRTQRALHVVLIPVGWLALLFVLWAAVHVGYREEHGRILTGWNSGNGDGPVARFAPLPYVTDPGELAVLLGPAHGADVGREVCISPEGPDGFTFFLKTAGLDPSDTIHVSWGDIELHQVSVTGTDERPVDVRIGGLPEGCARLQIKLSTQTTNPGARAELYFPRFE